MARYMIQTRHNSADVNSARFRRATMQAGAHFVANADWRFLDDELTASLIVDVVSERDALLMVPPVFRSAAVAARLDAADSAVIGDGMALGGA